MLILYDKDLVMLRPIDNALKWGYHEKLNELTTGSMTLPAGDPITARIDVPGSFVRAYDGERDLGYFCVSGISEDKHAPRGTITYQLQGAEATLTRRLMDGWHEIGGTGYPTRRVIEYILGLQRVRRWALGECAYTDYYQYNFNDTTLLESLLSLGEVLLEDYIFVFDSTATPWTVHLRRAPGEATRSLVYRRNMTGLSRSVDGRIITRLYGRGYGEGDNQMTIASVNGGVPYLVADEATLERYGDEWDGVHVDTRQTDPLTLKAHMARILEAGKRPTASYEATATDLARLTGEPWDDIRIGDKVIILDELLGEPVTVRCAGRKKDDVEGDPGGLTLTLDNSRADTAEELSEIRDKIGVHELYSQGATNMYSMQISDNADAAHPLVMRFYVPGNVLRINSCLIYWQTERFRTYATLAKSGGGSTRTSQIGGGATVSLPVRIVTTSASTGAPMGGEGTSALYTESNEVSGLTTKSAGGGTTGEAAPVTGNPVGSGSTAFKSETDAGGPTATGDGGGGDTGSASGSTGTPISTAGGTAMTETGTGGPDSTADGGSGSTGGTEVNTGSPIGVGGGSMTSTGTGGPTSTGESSPGTSSEGSHSHTVDSHAHNMNAHKHSSSSSGPSPAVTVAVSPGTNSRGSHSHTVDNHAHSVDQHSHGMNHYHAVGSHQHSLSAHKHSIAQHSHGMNHVHDLGSHSHTMSAHAHSIEQHTHGMNHYHNVASHSHTMSAHTHDIDPHTHRHDHWHRVTVTMTIPAMAFELESHSHTVTIPAHTHELEYGVYEGERSASIAISVDGEAVPAAMLTEDRELDVARYLRKNGDGRVTRGTWHEIEFTPEGITRITADLFFQVFIQSRGAGDY